MRRTLLTARPVIEGLKSERTVILDCIEIVPFIFEKGGCYTESGGVVKTYPGLSSEEATALLPEGKCQDEFPDGWWKFDYRETDEEVHVRVLKTVKWIKNLENIDILILVTHEWFACACMKSLLNANEFQTINWLYNSSFSSLNISSGGSPRGYSEHGGRTVLRPQSITVDYINAIFHLPTELIS